MSDQPVSLPRTKIRVSPAEFTLVMVTVRAERDGRESQPSTGASPVGLPSGCNSLFKRGVSRLLREPLAGTTVQTLPGTSGHLRALFSQFSCVDRPGELRVFRAVFRLKSEKPQLRSLLRPPEKSRSGRMLILIGPIARFTAGTTGACFQVWERVLRAGAASSSITRVRPAPTTGTTGTAGAAGVASSARASDRC
jgi:hypothetical protein